MRFSSSSIGNMSISSLFTRFFDLAIPKRCAVCRELVPKNSALCPACEEEYKKERLAECGICGHLLCECACPTPYLSKHGVKRLVKLFRYRPSDTHGHSLNLLLYRLKHDNVSALRDFLAEDLKAAMDKTVGRPLPAVITFVPRTVRERRKYGFDQSGELAKALAKKTGIPFAVLLKRAAKTPPQKKLRSTEERIKNAKASYAPACEENLRGRTVFLLDDTVTTGSSIAACAHILRTMGAREIVAIAPFLSYRHKNIAFEHAKNSREERFYAKK